MVVALLGRLLRDNPRRLPTVFMSLSPHSLAESETESTMRLLRLYRYAALRSRVGTFPETGLARDISPTDLEICCLFGCDVVLSSVLPPLSV